MSPSSSRSLSGVFASASASASWPPSAPSRASSASVTSTSCWLTTGPPTVSLQKFALCKNPLRLLSVRPAPTARAGPEGLHSQSVSHNAHCDLRSRHRLPDRLLFACRTGCCRTTLAVGTSSWGSGSALARPSRSSPRFSEPFCPVAGRDAVVAGRDAVPVRPEPEAAPPPLARAGAGPGAACRPLALPLRAPLAAVLAPEAVLASWAGRAEACRAGACRAGRDPDEAGRAWFCAGRAGPPVVAPPTAPSAPPVSVVQFLNMKYCWPSVHRLVVTQYRTRPYCQYSPVSEKNGTMY